MKIPIIAAFTILTTLIAIPLATPISQATDGNPVLDSRNVWYPYGPYPYDSSATSPGVNQILYQFYNGPDKEFQDFETGKLDLPDAQPNGVPPSSWTAYHNNPDFLITPVQGQFGDFGINFNQLSNRFKAWGCDFNKGRSTCGLYIRSAFAHLLDRQQLVIDGPLTGAGQALADPSPPAKVPAGSTLAEQCSWDSIAPYHNNCTFAYHVSSTPCSGGFCTDPSQPDFCAAVNYVLAAGTAPDVVGGSALTQLSRDMTAPIDPTSGLHCGIDPSSPGLATIAANPMLAFIRNNDVNRLYMGDGERVAMNTLFTRTVVSPTYGTIAQARPCVFRDGFTLGAACWDWYTYGFGLGGPFPDHIYGLYHSTFASNACGGTARLSPPNNGFYCIPELDADSLAAQNSGNIADFVTHTIAAFHDFGSHLLDIPAYTPGLRTAALKCAAGLVNQLGFGYNNFYTLLSAHKGACTPSTGFDFGNGDYTTLRYGQSGATSQMNVFHAQTVWEVQVIGQIYDTLFAGNPVLPSDIICWMCDNYVQTVDLAGNTHFNVELRQGLKWQDGQTVTAYDVKFSLMNERDFSDLFGSGASGFLLDSTSVLSNTHIDIVMSGVSVDWLPILSGTLIIPRHIWELPGDHTYGEVGVVDPARQVDSYDPLASGTLIGSSEMACVSLGSSLSGNPFPAGFVGGGCASTAGGSVSGQAIPPGGTMLIKRYDFSSGDPLNQWIRSYNTNWGTASGGHSGTFQEFRWADRFDNDKVTVQDLVSVGGCAGASTAPTASCPALELAHWRKTAFETGGVIGPEVTTVASHIDDTWLNPFSWSGDPSKQPGISTPNVTPWT